MSEKIYNVLFLCTGNSARSIMAECALNRCANGRFRAFSAGSHPRGEIHPLTLHLLRRLNYRTEALRSKSWDEFQGPEAPLLDFVFTVCDAAALETCPIFPGQPMTAHWGVEDPAVVTGSEDKQIKAFRRAYVELESRVKIFASLRLDGLDRLALQGRLRSIGQSHAPTEICAGDLRDVGKWHPLFKIRQAQGENMMESRVGGHITIQVSAPEHSGKTSLMVLLYEHLRGLGANVILQKADPQIDEKLAAGEEALRDRLKSVDIVIMEMQTHR